MLKAYIFAIMGKNKVIQAEITQEERDIVRKLADGVFGNTISKEMGVNYNTFAFQLGVLKNKCCVKTTPHLVAFFIRNKLID